MAQRICGVYFDCHNEPEDERPSGGWLAGALRTLLPKKLPKGCLDFSREGHAITVELAVTTLESVPGMWQRSITEHWLGSLYPDALARYQELMARAIANPVEAAKGVDLAEKAWLCGVLPAEQTPPSMIKAKIDAEAAWAKMLADAPAAAKAEAERLAGIKAREEAELAEAGIRFIDKTDESTPLGANYHSIEMHSLTQTFAFQTDDGVIHRFTDSFQYGMMDPRICLLRGGGESDLPCEVDAKNRPFYMLVDPESKTEQRCYLSPGLTAAYRYVRSHDWYSAQTSIPSL
jgi:hypothetical protein